MHANQATPAFLDEPEGAEVAAPRRPSVFKSMALLLTSFIIAYNLAIALHEAGHALANDLAGGSTAQITLNPFWFSYTSFSSNPEPLVALWGGAFLPGLVAVAAWALLSGVRSPLVFPLRLLAVLGLALNGVYLLLDQPAGLGGDGSMLVLNGVSRPVVEGVGAVLLALGLLLGLELAPVLGIWPRDSLARRLLVYGGGVLPYLGFAWFYVSEFHPQAQAGWLLVMMGGAAAVLVYALIGWLAPGNPQNPSAQFEQRLPWWQIEILMVIGLAIVAAELWYFPL